MPQTIFLLLLCFPLNRFLCEFLPSFTITSYPGKGGTQTIQTSDGGFLVASHEDDVQPSDNFMVVKYSANGLVEWQKKMITVKRSQGYSVWEGSGGFFYSCGRVEDVGRVAAALIKFFPNGTLVWSKTKINSFNLKNGVQDSTVFMNGVSDPIDGTNIVVGMQEQITETKYYPFFLKFDGDRNVIWRKRFNGTHQAYYILARKNTFVIGGEYITPAPSRGSFLMEVDHDFTTTLWSIGFGRDGTPDETYLFGLKEMRRNNRTVYGLSGAINQPGGRMSCYVMLLNETGRHIWTTRILPTNITRNNLRCNDMIPLDDGASYYLVGGDEGSIGAADFVGMRATLHVINSSNGLLTNSYFSDLLYSSVRTLGVVKENPNYAFMGGRGSKQGTQGILLSRFRLSQLTEPRGLCRFESYDEQVYNKTYIGNKVWMEDNFTMYWNLEGSFESWDEVLEHDVDMTTVVTITSEQSFQNWSRPCWSCQGSLTNGDDGRACSGHGSCELNHSSSSQNPEGVCNCSDNSMWRGEECSEERTCNQVLFDNYPDVCFGFGNCTDFDTCVCFPDHYGTLCNGSVCFDVYYNESTVCESHGSCVDVDKCECYDNYFGMYCNVTTCGGEFSNTSRNPTDFEFCHRRGTCSTQFDSCRCSENYYGNTCDVTFCDDVFSNTTVTKILCEGHGVCKMFDNCSCLAGYSGSNCNSWSCFGIPWTDEDVCGGHGSCIDIDVCVCKGGTTSSNETTPCDEWYCGIWLNTNSQTCSGRGECMGVHICKCYNDYEGLLCDSFSCGSPFDNPLTCSGNGDCVAPGDCDCNTGYGGSICEKNNLWVAILTPALSVVGVGVIGLFLMLVNCCLVCCTLALVFITGLVSCLLLSVMVMFSQRRRMKKFEMLRDVNLLLKEQELDEDTSVAHMRINRELYVVQYDEIKIQKLLGEGGSMSAVYLAIWQKREVAFKCFKTRLLCSSQDLYDEFEREVEIIGNISHPNIIRFFGATLKPPRVGIVMEYCSNGDLDQFFDNFVKNHGMMYPFPEKLRMLYEISASLKYLHSRSIIHRDIKMENVLVDSSYSCKLMDFGLSRMVERVSAHKTAKVGTSFYMAPELITAGGVYDEKCDVFSFSILMFAVLTENRRPYKNMENIELKVASNPNLRPDCEEILEVVDEKSSCKWIVDLVRSGWSHNPKERKSFDEISSIFGDKLRVRNDVDEEEQREEKIKTYNDDAQLASESGLISSIEQHEGNLNTGGESNERGTTWKRRWEESQKEVKILRERIEQLEMELTKI